MNEPDSNASRPPLVDVLRRHTPTLMNISGVVGTGEGRDGDQPVVVVYVSRRSPEVNRRLPSQLDGYAVQIREVGEVTAPPR